MIDKNAKIYVAGHKGLVGSAIMRALKKHGYMNIVSASHSELDLRNQEKTKEFFACEKPEFVYFAAATVGGIIANSRYPAKFIYDNLMMQTNTIDAAYQNGCKKFLFLGSSCIYPKYADQPIQESSLLTGALESTNESYAVAKIAGIKMCQAYRREYGFDVISVLPINLYGPGDSFSQDNSHVVPAMIRRFHEAKEQLATEVSIWGTGTPLREFMHVDDLADACLFLMDNYSDIEHVNCGAGHDITTMELAKLVAKIIGYKGQINTDASRPDGTPRKLTDSTKLFNMGWHPSITLEEGLEQTYKWYCANVDGDIKM